MSNPDIAIGLVNNHNLLGDKSSKNVRHLTADMSALFQDRFAPKHHRCFSAKSGFMLIEAIAAVLIVSVSLVLISQSLLTNFRAHMRFAYAFNDLRAMNNAITWAYFVTKDEKADIIAMKTTNINPHLISTELSFKDTSKAHDITKIKVLIERDVTVTTKTSWGG